MKSRINLYTQELQPTYYLVNLSLAAAFWLMAFITIVVLTSWADSQASRANNQLDMAEQASRSKQQIVQLLTESQANLKQDPALLAAIEKRQRILDIKSTVAEELSIRHDQKSNGFAELMLDLAENHQNDVWLTRIHLDAANIRIEGGASKSSSVPKWVRRLSDADYFQGKAFASARLFRNADEQLNFVLSSASSETNDQSPEGADNGE